MRFFHKCLADVRWPTASAEAYLTDTPQLPSFRYILASEPARVAVPSPDAACTGRSMATGWPGQVRLTGKGVPPTVLAAYPAAGRTVEGDGDLP
jgi:hypothetical protein